MREKDFVDKRSSRKLFQTVGPMRGKDFVDQRSSRKLFQTVGPMREKDCVIQRSQGQMLEANKGAGPFTGSDVRGQ